MGKRDTELETDAELWARVARSAKPIAKGRIAPAVEAAETATQGAGEGSSRRRLSPRRSRR